jgi:hypothetical protein
LAYEVISISAHTMYIYQFGLHLTIRTWSPRRSISSLPMRPAPRAHVQSIAKMWPRTILISIILFYSLAVPSLALPIHPQAILRDPIITDETSDSLSIQNHHLPAPHGSECGRFCDQLQSLLQTPGSSKSTLKAEKAGHGRREQAQGRAKQKPTPQTKTHKAPTHHAERIASSGHSRTGIFIVKAMLCSAILCCVVEISFTVTRW